MTARGVRRTRQSKVQELDRQIDLALDELNKLTPFMPAWTQVSRGIESLAAARTSLVNYA